MKWFIASDIHGSALYCGKMLDRFNAEGCDRLLLLGDILYHGPRNDLPEGYAPKEVIAMLSGYADRITCVRGNCDADVDQMVLPFPVLADYALLDIGDRIIFATHGHLYNIDALPPVHSGDILLYGHTHVPLKAHKDGITFVNPGSVSIPKCGSERGYIVFSSKVFEYKTLDGKVYDRLVIE